ncbi:hypothetical protein C8Q80DRAFT_1196515 [Daedaleopsis nitida]|nr:hypothetical protein C8Q80DRAFT_1196515 [Daedaleopsis nitida]
MILIGSRWADNYQSFDVPHKTQVPSHAHVVMEGPNGRSMTRLNGRRSTLNCSYILSIREPSTLRP